MSQNWSWMLEAIIHFSMYLYAIPMLIYICAHCVCISFLLLSSEAQIMFQASSEQEPCDLYQELVTGMSSQFQGTMCTYSQCLVSWSYLWHVCFTVSRCGMCFGMLSQLCVRRRTLKEFQEVSEVSNTSLTRVYGRFSRLPFFAFLAAALSYSSILPWISQDSDCILALCLHFHFYVSLVSPLFLPHFIYSFIFHFDVTRLLALLQW